jgi:hypothetical protein
VPVSAFAPGTAWIADRAVVWCDDDDFAPRFGFGAFLLELCDAAIEQRSVASELQRQVGALGFDVHALAHRGEPAALGCGEPCALFEQLGLHLLHLHLGYEALGVQLAVQRFRTLGTLAKRMILSR